MKQSMEEQLKQLNPPPPDPQARLAAKRAALDEFARAQATNQAAKKATPGFFQGLLASWRLNREQPHGRDPMAWSRKKTLFGGLATACVAVLGFFLVRPVAQQEGLEIPKGDSAPREIQQPAGQLVIEPLKPELSAQANADQPKREPAQTQERAVLETRGEVAPVETGRVRVQIRASEKTAASGPVAAASPPTDLEEITVEGERLGLVTMEVKRNAEVYVDSINAEDVGKFPDKRASEALQRAPGVQLSRLSKDKSDIAPPAPPVDAIDSRDDFTHFDTNSVQRVADAPVSTFSADVDTASYTYTRAALNNGQLPKQDAVRAEEFINYFRYSWPAADQREAPFKPTVVVSNSPWAAGKKLVHIGIKGYELDREHAPNSNLVLLLDVSGSMDEPNKLPLVKQSMGMLLSSLKPTDTVGIVVYAGQAGVVLEPTRVSEKAKILAALENLSPGGSTAGAAGIKAAYELAEASFRKDGVNRILLATDGDFNVGTSSVEDLKGYVERQREKGIFLSVLGFGMGNYQDDIAQALAQNGNGVAAYIDSAKEAQRVLVQEATSSLFTIAKDVKLQVEFNPATVSEYRLIGYETRALRREDFNNDAVDAGDIGAGHTVTAIYEITPAGSSGLFDRARYPENERPAAPADKTSEYGFLKIRYKLPDGSVSRLIEAPIPKKTAELSAKLQRDVNFSTAAAGFAQLLRGGRFTNKFSYDDVVELGLAGLGDDPDGSRAEFLKLVRRARSARKM